MAECHRRMVFICGTQKQCACKKCVLQACLWSFIQCLFKIIVFFLLSFVYSNYLFQPVLLLPSFLCLCQVQYPSGRSCIINSKESMLVWFVLVPANITSSSYFFSENGDSYHIQNICRNNCDMIFCVSWVSSSIHVLQGIWQRHFLRVKVRGRYRYWGVEEGRKGHVAGEGEQDAF